jgi:hypothetical protein
VRGLVVLVAVALAAVTVAGCGGSSSHTGSTAAPSTQSVASSTTTAGAPTATPKTKTTQTQTAAPAVATTTTGASNVRLPATFSIASGGQLMPPTIGAPAGVTVELTVLSHDSKADQVVVAGHRLSVPAGGSASALLSRLQKRTYTVAVDGLPRGSLVIGVAPGP